MRSLFGQVMRGAIVVAALSLAACGTSSTTQSSTATPSANGTPTAQPTVVKAKPTPPTVTTAFCKNILSVAEANQIMKPSATYIDVVAESGDNTGSCNYVYAPSKAHFQIYFEPPWNGPVPIPQQDISNALAELVNQQLSDGTQTTVTEYTNVSGVGDQAAFLAVQVSKDGTSIGKIDAFYVLTGKVLFICGNYFFLDQAPSAPPDATQKGELQQCGEQVVSRL